MAYINHDNIIISLGTSTDEVLSQIHAGITGIKHEHNYQYLTKSPVSVVSREKIEKETSSLNSNLTFFEKITSLSLQKVLSESLIDVASPRTLFILSTTKGNVGLLKTEQKDSRDVFLHHTAGKISRLFGFKNDPVVVCNACISGVLAIIVAKRYIDSGKYDNVVITGADVVNEFIVAGFESFKSMSELPCRPFDADRDGLSLGEGAGTVVISKDPSEKSIRVVSGASANDANHISGPSRTGEGLFLAIKNTVKDDSDIDFISAHGTATPYNDDMESFAIHRAGLDYAPVNSFKGYFGHTLGAAGIIETILTKHSMLQNLVYKSLGTNKPGTIKNLQIIDQNKKIELKRCLKLSSGFGGCNAAILLEK
ncbi:MAG: beta-ketoacyl synthase [Bacteroidales bacterium]|nr:beta-ketoacyl synthase [Bacteroidales bacterium]